MSKHTKKSLPKNTIEFTLQIPWKDVQTEYDVAFDAIHKTLAVDGFREGKVPKAIAEKNISKDAVYQKLIHTLFPRLYNDLIKEENLHPIASPKVEIVKAKENEDWEVKMTVPEKPEVVLGKYKEKVKKALTGSKKAEIWVPGKDEQKRDENAEKQQQLNEVLSVLLKEVQCEISDIVIDEEVETRLARLVDDIQKLGLTVETYVQSRNTTVEDLKTQMKKEVEEMYKIEFILMAIGDEENIQVEKEELDKLFSGVKSDQERANAQANMYYFASVLRKQKVLDFITNL
ncbi:hypothetical protein HGB07_06710 [Candidatus Roizmanbacteria bacterium]|nr:hypothetical protein [Candidatus Roizmanbacteria bacterium]